MDEAPCLRTDVVEAILRHRGITKSAAAKRLGVSPSYLADVLSGRRGNVSITLFVKLAQVLDVVDDPGRILDLRTPRIEGFVPPPTKAEIEIAELLAAVAVKRAKGRAVFHGGFKRKTPPTG